MPPLQVALLLGLTLICRAAAQPTGQDKAEQVGAAWHPAPGSCPRGSKPAGCARPH